MRRKKDKPVDQSTALDYAVRVLGFKARSIHELTVKMRDKGYHKGVIEEVIERCLSYGYIDDRKFAINFAKSRLRSGKSAGSKVLMELRMKGVSEADIEVALNDALEEISPREVITEIVEKRYSKFSYEEADEKERRKVLNYFLRRGFNMNDVLDIIRAT